MPSWLCAMWCFSFTCHHNLSHHPSHRPSTWRRLPRPISGASKMTMLALTTLRSSMGRSSFIPVRLPILISAFQTMSCGQLWTTERCLQWVWHWTIWLWIPHVKKELGTAALSCFQWCRSARSDVHVMICRCLRGEYIFVYELCLWLFDIYRIDVKCVSSVFPPLSLCVSLWPAWSRCLDPLLQLCVAFVPLSLAWLKRLIVQGTISIWVQRSGRDCSDKRKKKNQLFESGCGKQKKSFYWTCGL